MQCTHGFVRDPLDKYRLFMVNGWVLLHIGKACGCCLAGHSGMFSSHVGSDKTVVKKWRASAPVVPDLYVGFLPGQGGCVPPVPAIQFSSTTETMCVPLAAPHPTSFCFPSSVKHYPTFISRPWGKAVTGVWATGLFSECVLGVR